MKKSTVAVGVIAVLAVGYVGVSWYTGNVIESNIDKKIEQVTQQVNQNLSNYTVSIQYSDYQKNIFSTQMHVTIKLLPKENRGEPVDEESSTLFNDEITIHHGPFPLEALKHGQFSPQMAWVNYDMTEKASPELWQLAGNQPFISGSIGISYQQYITLKLANKAINRTSDNASPITTMSAGELITLHANKDFTDVVVNGHLNDIELNEKGDRVMIKNLALSAISNNENNGFKYTFGIDSFSVGANDSEQLVINNVNSVGSFDKNYQMDSKITIDNVKMNTPQQWDIPGFVFNNVVIGQKSSVDNQAKVSGELTTSIGSFAFGNQQLGNGDISVSYKGLDNKLWLDSMIEADPAQVDMQDKTGQVDHLQLSLNNLSWHNNAGDLKAQFGLSLSGENLNVRDPDLESIDNFDMNVNIPFKVLAQMVAQVQNPQAADVTPKQIEKATKLVYMSVGLLLGDVSPAIDIDKEGIRSDVKYSKGNDQVIANGNTYNKDEFFKKVSKKF